MTELGKNCPIIRDVFNDIEKTNEVETAFRMEKSFEGADVNLTTCFVKALTGYLAGIYKNGSANRQSWTEAWPDFKTPWCRATEFREYVPGVEIFWAIEF